MLAFLDSEQPMQQRCSRKKFAAAVVDTRKRVQCGCHARVYIPELLRLSKGGEECFLGFVKLLFRDTPACNFGERVPSGLVRIAHCSLLPSF